MITFYDFGGVLTDGGTVTLTDEPYYYNDALLVTFTGSNGSTSFTDNSRQAFALTAQGNAQIQSNKLELDGTGDYVSAADSMLWTPGSRMTWEVFGLEFDSTTGAPVILSHYNASGGIRSWELIYDSGNLTFVASANGTATTSIAAAWTPTLATAYDIAATWDGATIRLYVNGIFLGSGAWSSAFNNSSAVLAIGCNFVTGTASNFLDGRISAVRITRGIDRAAGSTSSFVRHALPLPAAQSTLTDSLWGSVVLLVETLSDGTIRDASPYDWKLTVSGNAVVSTSVEPFSDANSIELDGTGDYLEIPDHPILEIGGGDVTFESFVRHSANTTAQQYASKWDTTGNNREWVFGYRGDLATDIMQYARSADGSSSTLANSAAWTPTTGVFYHAALCRNGSNHRIFIDGTQSGSTETTAVTVGDRTSAVMVGAQRSAGTPVSFMNGYLSELRITKAARYTSGFTPASAPYPRG